MSGNALGGRRATREEVERIVSELLEKGLRDVCEKFEVCGSYRRKNPTSGDVDIVIVPNDKFDGWYENLEYEKKIGKWAHYLLVDGVQVDLFLSSEDNFGVTVLNFTGSPGFNVFMWELCYMMGLSFNKDRIINIETNEVVSKGLSERDIFKLLRMNYIEPGDRF